MSDSKNLPKNETSQARTLAEQALEHQRKGREQEALTSATQSLKLEPTQADMWHCIGYLLLQRGRWDEAARYLRQAVELASHQALFRTHYAMALMEANRLMEASAEIKDALLEDAFCPDAYFVAGEILSRAGHYDRAISYYEKARSFEGLSRTAMFAEGGARIMVGEFDRGFALIAASDPAHSSINLPDWQGETGPHQHVVVCGHYGFGDLLLFVRYVEKLRTKVARVTLELPQLLVRLIRQSFPDIPILVYGRSAASLSAAELSDNITDQLPKDATARCFYMNLPHILGTPFDPCANTVPYIKADAQRVAFWNEKLQFMPSPRIGLVWSGNPLNQNDHNRSVPFSALDELIKAVGPHLVSLQRGDEQKKCAEKGLFDATPFIEDFADSAACMAALDLIITVDSAPAHLAGALGRPVWTLLTFSPEWRWLMEVENTIWYPTMKLFRQLQPKDWATPVGELLIELNKWLKGAPLSSKVLSVAKDPFLTKNPRALKGF